MAKKTLNNDAQKLGGIEIVDKSKIEADPNAKGKWEENRSKLRQTLQNYHNKFWKKDVN